MSMGMRLIPNLRHLMQCSVCLQNHDSNKADAVNVEVVLFGSVAFAICPCCGQKAPNMTAKAYLARAAAWVQRLSMERLREKLGPCQEAGPAGEKTCDFASCPQKVVHLALCPLWTDEQEEGRSE